RALANASSPHGYQSTGLWACSSRYGLFSCMRWLVYLNFDGAFFVPVAEQARARIASAATATQARLTTCVRNWRGTFKIGVPSCDVSCSTLLVESQCLI